MKTVQAACLIALVCLPSPAAAEDSVWLEDAIGMEMSRSTLANFSFEGLKLSTPLAEFLRKFPTARRTDDAIDDKSGLTCYTVDKLESADSAQFYFVAGKLYQMEIEYKNPRIEAQGGLEAVVRKVVGSFGIADGVYGNRRTWQQPHLDRRADFYTSRVGAQLVITDTSQTATINQRQKRTALEENVELGF